MPRKILNVLSYHYTFTVSVDFFHLYIRCIIMYRISTTVYFLISIQKHFSIRNRLRVPNNVIKFQISKFASQKWHIFQGVIDSCYNLIVLKKIITNYHTFPIYFS